MGAPSFSIANMYVKAIMSLDFKQQELIDFLKEVYSILPYNLGRLDVNEIQKIPFSKEVKNFILILYSKKHLPNLKMIFLLLQKAVFAKFNIKEVTITTVKEFTPEQALEAQRMLEKFFNSKIDLKFKIDASILGGFTMFFDNFLFDDSKKLKIFKIKSCILK